MAQELPLTSLHRQAGAILQPWRDWVVPWRFAGLDSEYRAVRHHAGLIDWSVWGLIEVRGVDRVSFLQNLLTNDIKKLQPGAGCQAALLTSTAKLVADLLVLADHEAHWLVVQRSHAAELLKTLDRYLITEQVTLHDQTQTHALLSVQGPGSASLLSQLIALPRSFRQPLEHALLTIDGVPLRGVAHSLTGEPGAILVVPTEHAGSVWNRLLQQGRPAGLLLIGWETLNVLRLEAGIPWDGIDMDETTLLPETGLEEHLVSYTKGCYVGQEIVARLQTYGSVSRKLVGLACDGRDVPEPNDPITKDGQSLGHITSACLSPTLQQPIALGYVKRPFYEIGTTVTVLRTGRAIPATLANRPFVAGTVRAA
ncbi:MAG: aminomethyl transferase family protein [Candidatus Omnitrophica bacterium]|nr:aminomethyl transferase family protein [Candidatus Omnitrophota bacterium]